MCACKAHAVIWGIFSEFVWSIFLDSGSVSKAGNFHKTIKKTYRLFGVLSPHRVCVYASRERMLAKQRKTKICTDLRNISLRYFDKEYKTWIDILQKLFHSMPNFQTFSRTWDSHYVVSDWSGVPNLWLLLADPPFAPYFLPIWPAFSRLGHNSCSL